MADDITGQSATPTAGESGEGVPAPAATPPAGVSAPPASVDNTPALQQVIADRDASLAEQRKIQSGLDKTIADLKAESAKLTAEVARLNEVAFSDGDVKSKYEETLGGVRDELTQVQGQATTLQQQLEAQAQEIEQLRIIAAEFPGLAPLLTAEALPRAASVDDFRAKMQALSEQFVPTGQAAAHAKAQGSRPPASPPASQTISTDTLADEMSVALKAGDMARFTELREQWYATSSSFKDG